MLSGVIDGHYRIVFFKPLLARTIIVSKNLRVLVIDESHTVKKWGETFHQTMLCICEKRSLMSVSVRMLALTNKDECMHKLAPSATFCNLSLRNSLI